MSQGGELLRPLHYISNFLYIRTKDMQLKKLEPKPAQMRLYQLIEKEWNAGRPVRVIILKARQLGFSTMVEGLFFALTATTPLVKTGIVAHESDAASNLFGMNKLFYDMLPAPLKPMQKYSNAKELVFENPTSDEMEKAANPGLRSGIRVFTAGAKGGMGRSYTIHYLHLSEIAFWPGDAKKTFAAASQAVPDLAGTIIAIESTPNGMNFFKDEWDAAVAGESGFIPFFCPWYEEPEYRMPVEPGTEWTEEEREMMESFRLEPEQMMWRRWCIKTKCGRDINIFREEYPTTAEEAFLLSGTPFFDNMALMALLRKLEPPLKKGTFAFEELADKCPTNFHFVEGEKGPVTIYEEPIRGVHYVLGGDTAGDGSDRFTAYIMRNDTGVQVAQVELQTDEWLYTQLVYMLGIWYEKALVAVETNFSTFPGRMLEQWGYGNLYVREKMEGKRRIQVGFGYQTNSATRPVALRMLWSIVHDAPACIRSRELVEEMLTFAYNEDKRPEAMAGKHDDHVMAAAIAYMVRDQEPRESGRKKKKKAKWHKDQYEDYYAATPEMQKELLREWGNPF